MLNALALSFNRSGGSFQSNIDGALAVRLIQGFVSQAGIMCAQLAKIGITGPKNFLEGVYGYFHLYAKDKYDPQGIVEGLGQNYEIMKTVFKKYPSCGATLDTTEGILSLVRERGITPQSVARVDIKVTPYVYKLAEHPFQIGNNPKVNVQFNIHYCVAKALLRESSKIEHFDEPFVRDPKIQSIVERIYISAAPALEEREEMAMEMRVIIKNGSIYHKNVDIAPGLHRNPLSNEENIERFQNCINYESRSPPSENLEKIRSLANELEYVDDVHNLIPLLLGPEI